METDKIRRVRVISLVVLTAMLSSAFVFGVRSRASTPPSLTQAAQGLLQVNQDGFPDVVAYANGTPISGKALAQRIYILDNSPVRPERDLGDSRDIALRQLIQEAILLDAAADLKIGVSTEEAEAYANTQKDLAMSADDPVARELYVALAIQSGVSPDEFPQQAEVIATYQKSLTLGKMYEHVRGTTPEGLRNDPEVFQKTLERFVEEHTKEVRILI